MDIVVAKNISGMQSNVPNVKRISPLWGQTGGKYEGRAWLESNVGEGYEGERVLNGSKWWPEPPVQLSGR